MKGRKERKLIRNAKLKGHWNKKQNSIKDSRRVKKEINALERKKKCKRMLGSEKEIRKERKIKKK